MAGRVLQGAGERGKRRGSMRAIDTDRPEFLGGPGIIEIHDPVERMLTEVDDIKVGLARIAQEARNLRRRGPKQFEPCTRIIDMAAKLRAGVTDLENIIEGGD
jgi:hypothetical protein